MVHNPGGDWNPGKGDNPSFIPILYRVSAPSQVVGNGISAINSMSNLKFISKFGPALEYLDVPDRKLGSMLRISG